MQLRRGSLFLTLLLCLVAAPRPLAQEPGGVAPPGVLPDVVFERIATTMAFERDGSSVESSQIAIRVNSVAGVESVGTIALPYMRDVATVAVHYVRTRKPSGTVVETPVTSAIDMPAEVTTAAPTFTDLYEKNINVQGLDVGDILEYSYSVKQSSLLEGHFWYDTSFRRDGVILEQSLEVSWPASRTVTVKSAPEVVPSVSTSNGRQIYRWRHSNPTALETEELVERYYARRDVRADVQVSSFESWAALGETMRELWRDRATVTPAIRQKALELTASATTPDARARALYDFVATNVRYIAVSMGIGRLRPHSAAEVLTAGFGDCKDKHTLLVALLRAVDIDVEAALIGPGLTVDPDVASPSQFNHVVSWIPSIGAEGTWLDTTLGLAPFGHLISSERDAHVLRVPGTGTPTLVRTPNESDRADLWRRDVTGTLGETGTLDATVRETFSGDVEVGMRTVFRTLPRARWIELVKTLPLAAVYGGTVSDVAVSATDDTESAFELRYRLRVESYSDWKDKHVTAPTAMQFPNEPSEDRPAVPWTLPTANQIATARIELADDIRASLPSSARPEILIERDYARYSAKVVIEGQVLTAERRWSTLAKEVPATAIDGFRVFVTDVRNGRHRIDVVVRSPWAWGATPTVDWYSGASPEVTRTLQAAATATRRRDYQEALASVRALLKADADSDAAWLMLGFVELSSGERERGLDTLRRRVAVSTSAPILRYFAERLTAFGQHTEALAVWQRGRQVLPEDEEIPLYLGDALLRAGRHAEAVDVLAPVRARQSRSARFQRTIGAAYLGAGRPNEGVAALTLSAELDASPFNLNNVAWDLAVGKVALDAARSFSERAVNGISADVNALALATVQMADVRKVSSLAAYWDTLGWVLQAQGQSREAERWLSAAWTLTGDAETASHLADVHRALGNTAEAARFTEYAAALGRRSTLLPSAASGVAPLDAASRMMQERTVSLPRPASVTGAASAEVLISIGASGRITAVRLIRGDTFQSALASALEGLPVRWSSPDSLLTQVVRRASVQCPATGGCSVMLHRTGDVTSLE